MPAMCPAVAVVSLDASATVLRRRAAEAADLARSMKEVVVKEHPLADHLADLVPGSVRVAASGRQRVNVKNVPSHTNGPLGSTPPSQRGTDHDETTTPRRRQQRPSRCDRPCVYTSARRREGRHTACSRTIAMWPIATVAVVVALLLHVATRGASLNGAAFFKLASSCSKTNGTETACRPAAEPFGGEKVNTLKRSPCGEEGSIDGT